MATVFYATAQRRVDYRAATINSASYCQVLGDGKGEVYSEQTARTL